MDIVEGPGERKPRPGYHAGSIGSLHGTGYTAGQDIKDYRRPGLAVQWHFAHRASHLTCTQVNHRRADMASPHISTDCIMFVPVRFH